MSDPEVVTCHDWYLAWYLLTRKKERKKKKFSNIKEKKKICERSITNFPASFPACTSSQRCRNCFFFFSPHLSVSLPRAVEWWAHNGMAERNRARLLVHTNRMRSLAFRFLKPTVSNIHLTIIKICLATYINRI